MAALDGGGAGVDQLTGAGAAVALAALVLDVAQELQELACSRWGGGNGEPANHVLEAAEERG